MQIACGISGGLALLVAISKASQIIDVGGMGRSTCITSSTCDFCPVILCPNHPPFSLRGMPASKYLLQ